MTLNELLSQKNEIGSVDILKQRVISDPDFKNELEDIYWNVCGKKLNKECPDCWNDAYFEIMSMLTGYRKFQLRAGAILVDQENGVVYNQHNISDKYALRHIEKHPESKELFCRY